MVAMQLHWDIFCRVVDNYGDVGVCWRLARQLAAEHGKRVRLWVDDLNSLQPLCPAIDVSLARQACLGVEILHWTETAAIDRVGEVIIEAFACELPAPYLAAMTQTAPRPCWINLEYLTAESWAEGCHGLASPHPSLPLVKYFFFPGFSAATGGLLREKYWLARLAEEVVLPDLHNGLDISLFCYDTAPVGNLLDLLAESSSEIRLHVAPGKPLAAVTTHLGPGVQWQRGKLSVLPFDFLPQDDYDRLLWRCDINFVRGEDSFVRAQWAGKPFVWQIYPQEEAAHLVKLEAFLARYSGGRNTPAANAAVNLARAWNSEGDLRQAWGDFLAARPEIATYNQLWASRLAENRNLAESLVKFCVTKV
ncbi:MAG: elongation factor P maturation arginine rhamnosyltransferase EarP [Azonexus sp.]|nr:elongation factor P maturation arginine rhamnosyltransferase EarP [Azonexus sp.]